MTKREQKERRRIKKQLQEEGFLPPDKPRLNRKKFVEEAQAEWNKRPESYVWDLYLIRALEWVLAGKERRKNTPSLEAVGAAKIIKTAIRLQQHHKEAGEQDKVVTYGSEYEAIKDILEA